LDRKLTHTCGESFGVPFFAKLDGRDVVRGLVVTLLKRGKQTNVIDPGARLAARARPLPTP